MTQRIIGLILIILLAGCSAIELNSNNQQATQQAEANINSTVESRFATQSADVTATLSAIYAQATETAESENEQIEQTQTAIAEITAEPEPTRDISPETTPDPESTAEVGNDFIPTSAKISIYGTVPIDSDSLNSITALALDYAGNLLVSLRAGDIYRLDDEGDATLIFEDEENDIGQVSGLFVEGTILYLINGEQLSQVQDNDEDGIYDTVTQLSEDLPANQALLQANNSILRANDGRTFTVDVTTGDILLITFEE